jgi:hypothetical protein
MLNTLVYGRHVYVKRPCARGGGRAFLEVRSVRPYILVATYKKRI